MAPLSDAFALTRVINLRDRADRRREITAQLHALGMDFAPGRVELYAADRMTSLAGFDSLGTHGCFRSHLDILRDARDRGVDSLLVMEDDCEVLSRDLSRIADLAAALRTRAWHFAYFGHIVPPPEGMKPGAAPGWIEYNGPVQTTVLYAVNRPVLAPLIDYLEACLTRPGGHPVGGPMPVDGALTMFRAARPEFLTLLAQPVLARQRSSRSDISVRRFELIPGIRQAMSLARRIKRSLRNV